MFLSEASGKLSQRQEVASLPVADNRSSLLYLTDKLSNRRFLVDTGAAVSVFPHSSMEPSSGLPLTAANGNKISSWGTRTIPLRFGKRSFEWTFLLAAVDRPILGADWLAHNSLLVDLSAGQVLSSDSLQPINDVIALCETSEFFTALLSTPPDFRSLLSEFPELLSEDRVPDLRKHGVQHFIVTSPGPPVAAKARRLHPEKLLAAQTEFLQLEKDGVIRRSSSPWSSPLHLVPKADGSYRPCGDYRRLNVRTQPDMYPVPNMQDLSARLHGKTIFSKLDLKKGYHQIPLHPDDIPKTAVNTPFGLWEYITMPFGLRNASQTFQRAMDQILGDLPYVYVYLDDILIASTSREEHILHVRTVFRRLQDHGLVLHLAKCVIGVSSLEFLGYQLSPSGLTPLRKHVLAVENFPPPANLKDLQRYLGMLNFFRRFLPSIAQTIKPLTDLLRSDKKSGLLRSDKKQEFLWSPAAQTSFESSKRSLCLAATLQHPDPTAQLSLAVDASATHVGACLQQKKGKNWAPLAFFSKKLNPPEEKYSAFDRELLGMYAAVKHFRSQLLGRKFSILTDHKPLTHALNRVSEPWSARQQRHLSLIAEYT